MNWEHEAEVWERRYDEQTKLASEVIAHRDKLMSEYESGMNLNAALNEQLAAVARERDEQCRLKQNCIGMLEKLRAELAELQSILRLCGPMPGAPQEERERVEKLRREALGE